MFDAFPVSAFWINTPIEPFPEITFRAPAAVPPTVLFAVPRETPWPVFGSAPVPAAFVPIRLPWIVLWPDAVAQKGRNEATPPWFPEMRFPAPGAVPPTRLSRTTATPAWPLPTAAVPAAFVPIRLAWIDVPTGGVHVGAAVITPQPVLPETRFPAPGAPTTLLSPMTTTPSPFGTAPVPEASVPM